MKNKGCLFAGIILGAIALVGVFIAFWGIGLRNNMATKNQEVVSKWSNVETVYQKRANLIPNLEKTVKSYAKFEQETLTKVIEARSNATSIKIDPTNMTQEDLQKFQAAQGQLSGALSRLMAVAEAYPDLKADQQYLNFQREYIAVENSIRTETVYFNDAVKDFNNYVVVFPNSFIASFSNFKEKPYFKAEAGSEKAPQVFGE